MLAPAEVAASLLGDVPRAARQRPEKLAPCITQIEIEIHMAFIAKELGDKTPVVARGFKRCQPPARPRPGRRGPGTGP